MRAVATDDPVLRQSVSLYVTRLRCAKQLNGSRFCFGVATHRFTRHSVLHGVAILSTARGLEWNKLLDLLLISLRAVAGAKHVGHKIVVMSYHYD